jgi:hypothetical protein
VDMRDGWIYAAQEEGTPLVKIGYSREVQERIAALKTELRARHALIAAVYVKRLALQVERRIHRHLAAQHIAHEWFYLSMNQQRLESLAAHALGELLDEESQRALRRFNAHLRMRWRDPFRWLTAEEVRSLERAVSSGMEGAGIVVRIAGVLGVSLDYLAGRKDQDTIASTTA